MAGLAAGEPTYRIEESNTSFLRSFNAREVKDLAAGIPPKLTAAFKVPYHGGGGLASFLCPLCESGHWTSSMLQVEVAYGRELTVAAVVQAFNAEGIRIIRGRDEAIEQAASALDGFFVSSGKGVITVDQYHVFDCLVGQDGRLSVAPGASYAGRCEVRRVSADQAKQSETFEIKCFYPLRTKNSYELVRQEFSQSKGRVLSVTRTYMGTEAEAVPENLLRTSSLERIVWPEGPGYRQIRVANEKNLETGKYSITMHQVESWRVEKNGQRVLVKTEDLKGKDTPDDGGGELH